MEFKIIGQFSLTDVAAWWGAVVATAIFIWDVIKWIKSGPRIVFTASANMLIIGDPIREGKTYVSVKATNIGTQATTLSNLGMLFYKSKWNRLNSKQDKAMIITNPGIPHPIPHILEPGRVWDGLILQNEEVENMAKDGILEAALYCSHARKPLRARIKLSHNKSLQRTANSRR